MRFAVNIAGNNGPLNNFPITLEYDSVREWIESTRSEDNIFAILDWAFACHVPPSYMKLYVHIEDDDNFWEFIINLNNVREYKKYISKDRNLLESLVSAWRRNLTIDEILESKL